MRGPDRTDLGRAARPERAGSVLPPVGIVVLNWNAAGETLGCLASLRAQDYPNAALIVIDNGSAPDDLAALRAGLGDAALIANPRNLGFAGGVNTGIARALADGAAYVWLVNNDARVAPDALTRLVAAAEGDARLGLLSPVIRNLDRGDAPDFAGGLFAPAPLTFRMTANVAEGQAWQHAQPDRIWLTGTALLIRRAAVQRIGGFDAALFAYFEDNDYALRAAAAGFRNAVVPGAEVFHRSGDPSAAVPGKRPYFYYYMARNQILLLRKHGGLRRNARALVWALRAQAREARRWRAYPEVVRAIGAGIVDGLRGAGGAYAAERRRVGVARGAVIGGLRCWSLATRPSGLRAR